MSTAVSLTEPVDLAQRLIQFPSVTPTDHGCQAMLIDWLSQLGFEIHRLKFGVVENFYARLGHSGPNVCFAGHTDVVPPGAVDEWRAPPFSAEIQEGTLYGRGVCDMKGGVAAWTAAVARFLAAHPGWGERQGQGVLSFLITGDEEGDAVDGTVRVLEWLRTKKERLDYCVVGEPSSAQRIGDCIKNGRRGSVNGAIRFQGVQGHVAYPHLAQNPIHLAAPLLSQLAAAQWDRGNRFFDPTSFQFTNIQAGEGTSNVIPAVLAATFNIRFSPETDPETLEQAIRAILDGGKVPYTLDMVVSGLPFITEGGELLDALRLSAQAVTGQETVLSTGGGTSDARFISHDCAQTVEFGLVGKTMHKTNEQCPVADLETLTAIYQDVIQRLLPAVDG